MIIFFSLVFCLVRTWMFMKNLKINRCSLSEIFVAFVYVTSSGSYGQNSRIAYVAAIDMVLAWKKVQWRRRRKICAKIWRPNSSSVQKCMEWDQSVGRLFVLPSIPFHPFDLSNVMRTWNFTTDRSTQHNETSRVVQWNYFENVRQSHASRVRVAHWETVRAIILLSACDSTNSDSYFCAFVRQIFDERLI